ncbi:MAG: thiamine pyrophosphate-dependent enzyme [Burkholderiales bacterium]
MMRRDDCLGVLARHVTGEIVVPVFQAAFDWLAIRPDALNYTAVGAMGQASSHALGLALGRPDKRVIVLDGDGSLLMNLGSLVTIASTAPRNLVHFVCENDTYEANGAHPIPGAGRVDFAGLARAAGYRRVHDFAALDDFASRVGEVLREDGPVFATLRVVPGRPSPQDFAALHSLAARRAFVDRLRES